MNYERKIKKPHDLAVLGPKMAALRSSLRREFVWHYCMNSGDAELAYDRAGYLATTEGGRKLAIFKLTHSPEVLAAIGELGHFMVSNLTVPAIAAVAQIVADPNHKDRLKAAVTVLDRTGYAREHKVTVEHKSSDDEMARKAFLLAKEAGIDPSRLLGHDRVQALNAEFTEVADNPEDEDLDPELADIL